jgi:hypothetical protein
MLDKISVARSNEVSETRVMTDRIKTGKDFLKIRVLLSPDKLIIDFIGFKLYSCPSKFRYEFPFVIPMNPG